MTSRPQDGKTNKRPERRLADARHARRTDVDRSTPMPATGTSSPPHDVQTAKGLPRHSLAGGRERLVGLGRLERPTSRLSGVRSNQLSYRPKHGTVGTGHPPKGTLRPRPERLLAKGRADGGGLVTPDSQSRLSHGPRFCHGRARGGRGPRQTVGCAQTTTSAASAGLMGCLRKEVIQPQVPLRLPCYDFTPVADPTVDACLPLRG